MALPDPEVMEIDEDAEVEPGPLAHWRTPYLGYLICEAILVDKTKARWIAQHAKSFVVIEEELYKKRH
jgi:hypothetical protein